MNTKAHYNSTLAAAKRYCWDIQIDTLLPEMLRWLEELED